MNKQYAISLYDNLLNSYHLLSPRIENLDESGFNFIPSNTSILKKIIEEIEYEDHKYSLKSNLKHSQQNKFIDIGCGIPIFAYCIKRAITNLQVYGLENNKIICDYVRSAYISDDVDIIFNDALSYNQYDQYKYLYMFTPIRDEKKMHELLIHVLSGMKKDSILYLNSTDLFNPTNYIDEINKYAVIKRIGYNYLHSLKKI